MKILLVDDEKEMVNTLKRELSSDYIVEAAYSGHEAEELIDTNEYDIIILDMILPDMDGSLLCQTIRSKDIKSPILMLTGVNETKKKITALDSGADDYLTKPFHFAELHAHLRALLRRQPEIITSNILKIADLEFDAINRTVKRGNKSIVLKRKELQLLEYFMRNIGKVISRDMILEHLWDSSFDSFTNTIDVHVKYLRDQIDRPFEKKLIKTIYGMGYKLEE
jgi:DNA-binding response OmpR family regulator